MSNKQKEIQETLDSIDSRLMEDRGTTELREKRVTVLKELTNLDHIAQLDLAQKAKIQWGY